MKIVLKAASAKEVKSGGIGWEIRAGYGETPFGTALVSECPSGICWLSFKQPGDLAELKSLWPKAEFERDDEWANGLCGQIFMEASLQSLNLFVRGTEFQIRVWKELLEISIGETVSYGTLAEKIGKPSAARAVGTAVGRNPVGFLIPCHRVIRENGTLGGYRWGVERKRAILEQERVD